MNAIYKWDMKAINPALASRKSLINLVCEEFEVSEEGLKNSRRLRSLVDARCAYAHISRKLLKDTLIRIGMELGYRDHPTILNLLKRAEDLIYVRDPIAIKINSIEKKLLNQL